MAYFPLFVNLKHKEVLVIGGGNVAFQEISTFFAFEPKITLVAGQVVQSLEVLLGAYPAQIEYIHENPTLELIKSLNCNPTLVVLADNDPALNAELYNYYQDKNALVEDLSSRARCDFIFPAIIKRGDVVCGISSSGKNPLVSQFIKSLIESSLPQNISQINEHMEEIKRAVKQSVTDPAKRSKTLQTIFMRLIEDDNQTSDAEIDGIIADAEL